MTSEQILDRVQNIFRDIFDDDSLVITREIAAKDIEDWDSLTHINLIVAIEKEFKTKFSLSEMQTFKNVGDVIDLISSKIS